ncbi:hypothetical protein Chor_017075 [Crotalus horridus]
MAADPPPEEFGVAEERSGHCAVVDGNCLYVWGGYVSIEENEVYLPNDELWIYEIDNGLWLIYFGGYGCRKQNELSDCFDVHDAFWEGQIFWGWHNDVHVFDTSTQTWYQPKIKRGIAPQPRAAHSCAVIGNTGYVFGGRVLVMVGFMMLQQMNGNNLHIYHRLDLVRAAVRGHKLCQSIEKASGFKLGVKAQSEGRKGIPVFCDDPVQARVFLMQIRQRQSYQQGHCSDLLIFQTQPYSLLRLSLDCIGKNAVLLEKQLSWLPSRLLEEVVEKITFWVAVNHRQKKQAKAEEHE